MQDKACEFITPPETLHKKVTYSATGVDASMLEKAEQVIASLRGNYLEWVVEDLVKLQGLYDRARAEPGARKELLKDLFSVAHDIKGQGGSFGYDLMTAIGYHLCRLLEALDDLDDDAIEAIGLHLDAMRLVIHERMEGSGGAAGENMIDGLQAVVGKLIQR